MKILQAVILSPGKTRWGVNRNDNFLPKTNFAFRLKYSVTTSLPSGPGYVVDIVRSADQQEGTAWFLGSQPQKDVAHLVNALQTSFLVDGKTGDGGFFSTFSKRELIQLMTELDRSLREKDDDTFKKMLVQCVGRQPDSDVTLLNPNQMFTGAGVEILPEDAPYIWIESWPGSPPAHLYRSIEMPFSLAAIGEWIDMARIIQGPNFAATLLTLGSMVAMCCYRHLLREVGHFNLPLMYGPPMSGKTLTAQCMANITGASSVYSRCTLACITELCSQSSIPVVWDDPTEAVDVSQMAIDLGNGAIRGTRDRSLVPQTGCLVTANFDLGSAMKYYSRLNLITFQKARVVDVSYAMRLEEGARKASAALPGMVSLAQSVNAAAIRRVTHQIMECCRGLEVRLVEGMAVPLAVIYKILEALNLAGADGVFEYVQTVVIPAHLRRLGVEPMADRRVGAVGVVATFVADLVRHLTPQQIIELLRVDGQRLVVRAAELPKPFQQRLQDFPGCTRNVRIGVMKKVKKCRVLDVPNEVETLRLLLEDHNQPDDVPGPAEEPAQPVPEPALPVPQPALPVPEPALPVPQPALPVAQPALPVPEPAQPVPALSVPQPARPVTQPAMPVPEPALPVAQPALPVPHPALPVPQQTLPVPQPALPVLQDQIFKIVSCASTKKRKLSKKIPVIQAKVRLSSRSRKSTLHEDFLY